MLRLLCNENVPLNLVSALRSLGHDVAWIAEVAPGIADADVLRMASHDSRVCVTFDKDFGELAASTPAAAAKGVILLRLPGGPGAHAAARVAAMIDARDDRAGNFSVIEAARLRMRAVAPPPAS